MRIYIKGFLIIFQVMLLNLVFYFFRIININKNKNKKISWVCGVSEVASMLNLVSKIIKPVTTVCMDNNSYYNLDYDYNIKISNKYLKYLFKIFYGPILLGYLLNKNTHFWYMWNTGFLLNRDYEFKFLKAKNKKIICMFLGSDIRSPKLIKEMINRLNIDHFIEYIGTDNYVCEKKLKKIAYSADRYADIIISAKYDHLSYIKGKQYFFPYIYNEEKFCKNKKKFENLKKIKILHAPSNPIIKGTPLVRAAIKKLEIEGYDFEYIELQNIPNETVLEHLKSSHIVLNQFYAFVPGVFGIESMANNCAVLMSADSTIETGLPHDSEDAWMITRYWEVYDSLKYLLNHPEKIKYYADNGYAFAHKHYTYEAASKYVKKVLNENGIID